MNASVAALNERAPCYSGLGRSIPGIPEYLYNSKRLDKEKMTDKAKIAQFVNEGTERQDKQTGRCLCF